MSGVSHSPERLEVVFDEESLVADAGLLAAGALMGRLGVEQAVEDSVRLGGRPGGAPGRKVLSLVAAMPAGGDHIDHADRLRAGATRRVLPFAVMAPSTLGTFLRAFTWGHVRQLDKATGEVLGRAWQNGGGPGGSPTAIDVDSTVCGVSGKAKQGAAFGHTQQLGYHPLVASRAETGEVIHCRLRSGSAQRGGAHFVLEAAARARRAGARGEICVRADSGFFSYDLLDRPDAQNVTWSVTIPQYPHVKAAIDAIPAEDWKTIECPEGGEAAVAETTITAGRRGARRRLRIVVRRTRLTDAAQQQLWPDWCHHAFTTNRSDLDAAPADAIHRAHATVELAIRGLKQNAGLAHLPSQLQRQRRLAGLRRARPQPPPLAQPPQRRPPRQTHRRAHRQKSTPRRARTTRQPRRTTHPAPPCPLALGHQLPHRPHQHPRPAPTLLNTPRRPD